MRMRVRLGGVAACAVLLCAAAAPALAASGQAGGLVPTPLASAVPAPLSSVVSGVVSGITTTAPSPVQSTIDTLIQIVPSPLQSLLPQLTQVLPGGGDVTGGTTGGTGSRPHGAAGGQTGPASSTTRSGTARPTVTVPSIATGSVRLAPGGGAADRALRLAGPMSMPVAAAVLALFGIGVFARSRSSFQVLEDEKEAVGGWTVIRL